MVLVDTSVWIRALAERHPYRRELFRLLMRDEVAGHDMVYGELLIGDNGGRGRVLALFELIYRARTPSHDEVAEMVRRRGLQGRGVSWIDANLVASALVEDAKLWTADAALAPIADELGIAYRAG